MSDERGAVSRRTLLIGGAAVVAAGAVGVERVGWTDTLHKLRLKSSPDHHVPPSGTAVHRFDFDSAAMRDNIRYAIAAPGDARGVVICLHGRNDNYAYAFDAIHLHDVVAAAKVPLAVVGVDGGPDTYWHERNNGVDPQAMLQDELLPKLEKNFGGLPRALLGWSMGGYGALLTAERHPDEYKAVVGSSPALFTSAAATSPGAFDDRADFDRNNVFPDVGALAPLTVRVDCGTNDPFLKAVRTFAAMLPHPNLGSFTAGFHDASYWRSVAPAQIRTIATALGF